MTTPDHERAYPRVPLITEVEYRSTGSFLISYSLNLSRGGLFLETEQMLPVGHALPVRLSIPGFAGKVELSARVAWRRELACPDGMPAGLGLEFNEVETKLGRHIDGLIRDFKGMFVLSCSNDFASQQRLEHYLSNIFTCKVVRQKASVLAMEGPPPGTDLILIDLDSSAQDASRAIASAVGTEPPIPVVAISRHASRAARAKEAGAVTLVGNPPAFVDLRRAVLETLARPTTPGARLAPTSPPKSKP